MRTLRIFGVWLVVACFALSAWGTETWSYHSPSPTGNSIRDAWSPDGGTTVYFVGDGGLILKKVGTTYTTMESGTTAPLKGIHGTSATDIWAVGGSSLGETPQERSVILHFDGNVWSSRGLLTLNNPPVLSSTYDVYDVFAADASHVWVVGWNSQPWRWTGTTWAMENVNIALPNYQWGNLASIFGFSSSDVYAVGSWGTVLHFDGSQWSAQRQFETEDAPSSGSITFNLLQSVWGPNANYVFASGNSGQVYQLDRTMQNPNWVKINAGGFIFTAYSLSRMAGSSQNDVWFAGSGGVLRHWSGPGTPEGLEVHDTTPALAREALLRKTDGTYLLGGERGTIESLNPAAPTPVPLNIPSNTAYNLKYAGWTGKLWLVPEYSDAATGVFTWNGGRMTKRPIPGLVAGQVTAFAAFAKNDMWIATTDVTNHSLKRWNGSSWQDWMPPGYYSNQPPEVSGVAKTSSGSYVLLNGRYWASGGGTTGGNPCFVGEQNLDCLVSTLTENYFFYDLATDDTGKVYAVGAKVIEEPPASRSWKVSGGRVVVGQNGAWSTPADLGIDELRAVATGGGYVVAVGENRTAFYSTNGTAWLPIQGITRRPPPDDVNPAETFVDVVHAGNGVFYAIGKTSSHWTDGGKSFIWRIANGSGTLLGGGYTSVLSGLATDPTQGVTFAVGSTGSVLSNMHGFREQSSSITPILTLLLD
jgi:hypothetical protein